MKSSSNRPPTSLWAWWFITTVLYSVMSIFHAPVWGPYPPGDFIGHLEGFVGLFVPYGPLSILAFTFSPLYWVSLVFFLCAMFYSEKMLKKTVLTPWKKILMNIYALLVITTIVDIVNGTHFLSWHIFLYQYGL